TLNVGDVIAGAGVTAGTYITSAGTVSGTWNLSVTQTVATEAMTANNPGVGFDTISQAFVINSGTTGTTSTLAYATGTLSASLNLTQATGAVLSQGAIAATPSGAMNAIITQNTNWATFMTCWNATNAEKTGFAQWNGTQNNRFAYVMWDTNAAATVVPDTTTALSTILADGYGGVIPVYCDATLDPTGLAAAFVCGAVASINFSQKNGAITLAYRYQSGVPASVNDTQTAQNLRSNGYNFVGSVKSNAQGFTFVDNGSVTGEFLYAGSYINQIYFNAQIQLANLTLMTSVGVIPYNSAGAALIHAAHADPINQMLNFGGIQKGVSLSSLQAAEVNNAAGVQIDGILSTRGWYEQVGIATAQTRAVAGSPPNTIWYMYGGSVQKIAVSSVNVQ
ncbi:MAG: DUF3383 family protein, partial [Ferrovum sp.]|nr:DUF3383 family protein [Ferrovum sp.]